MFGKACELELIDYCYHLVWLTSTGESLATETVSESLDKIAENSGISSMDILNSNAKVTQEDVKQIAQLEPKIQKKIVDKVTSEQLELGEF